MIILHGTRLYGKVDQVPGLFHVATQFFYLQFIPLFPIGSYLVFDGTGRDDGGFAGHKIGFHAKSIFFAYARLALFLAGCATAIIAFIDAVERLERRGRVDWPSVGVMATISLLLFLMFWMSYRITHARPARALAMARKVGIPPETVAQFFAHKLRPQDLDALAEHIQAAEVATDEEANKVE